LSDGEIQAAAMPLGMPIASTIGLLGAPRKAMVVPWILNRNGQAVTMKAKFEWSVEADPNALRPMVQAAKAKGTPLTFATPSPYGTHAMWMRYFLGAGGVDPDSDVALITVPPPQMIASMKGGTVDGFCVEEPWNARAVADGVGYTAVASQEIWKDHPEKVCAFTEEFAQRNPNTVKAVLKALHEASVWLEDLRDRQRRSPGGPQPSNVNGSKLAMLDRMNGEYGDGRMMHDESCMIFSNRNCNYPQAKYATWWLSQLRRWGLLDRTPDYVGVVRRVMRSDIYETAMQELGYLHGGPDVRPEVLFDGVRFDPKLPEAYAAGFKVKTMKA
jgi:nitrate/nitrite transport system substrate-binding protein